MDGETYYLNDTDQYAKLGTTPHANQLGLLLANGRLMENDKTIIEKLQIEAREAAAFSYSPYSRFRVGAALLTEGGKIFRGANIENRSYGLANCAERSAIFAALSQGETKFRAIAIYSPDADELLSPCGACRQVISEFVEPDFDVYCSNGAGGFSRFTMKNLLPHDSLQDLKSGS